ncbi:hypothetical protein DSM104299_00260 [Baekduia alba]|uniref:DUF4238 domain-containing protein n=1 Tax=Baekduia alba TaxID=2997333 RepID=UPI00234193B5|nr:DUF4238 domain-containing protein [Baekduia alba]WCB91589.1 hypothetical protein DSM104299_00260 [Baekduia alba]
MSTEYTNNHYVPQWYQKRFIPSGQVDRELFLLDLKPDSFRTPDGVKRRRKAMRRIGTRKCFAIDDLYTTRFEGVESRELEQVFFGEVDLQGKKAVEFFATYDHDRLEERALEHMMVYMSTQKLRTPKGLDWLVATSGAQDRSHVLDHLETLRTVYGAIWSECAWQVADASHSPTKFIISDHPVTVYNRACAPGHPWCKGVNDPDIRLQATHTLFPLSAERVLILTNMLWACNPHRPPLELRPNPEFFRGAMFDFTELQVRRSLTEAEVLTINCIVKKRAYRFIAAGREEWLHPERRIKFSWRTAGDHHLLMPDPRSLHPGAEISMAYTGGRTEAMDTFGRRPGHHRFGHEAHDRNEAVAHNQWCQEFEALFGPQPRGLALQHVSRARAA